jgi:hypothetical protein
MQRGHSPQHRYIERCAARAMMTGVQMLHERKRWWRWHRGVDRGPGSWWWRLLWLRGKAALEYSLTAPSKSLVGCEALTGDVGSSPSAGGPLLACNARAARLQHACSV